MDTKFATTPITRTQEGLFEMLTTNSKLPPGVGICLVSCLCDGVPTVAVCIQHPMGLTPVYIQVTDKMDLVGPDGKRPDRVLPERN